MPMYAVHEKTSKRLRRVATFAYANSASQSEAMQERGGKGEEGANTIFVTLIILPSTSILSMQTPNMQTQSNQIFLLAPTVRESCLSSSYCNLPKLLSQPFFDLIIIIIEVFLDSLHDVFPFVRHSTEVF
jgi:hypothetical protein